MDDLTSRRLPLTERLASPWPATLRVVEPPSVPALIRRSMMGFFVVLCLAALAWPLLPRRYEAAGSVVLRPTDREGQFDAVQSMRQPMDDNAIQSEVDMMAATGIVDAVMARHAVAADPEFATPPLLARIKAWLRPGSEPARLSEADLRRVLRAHIVAARDRRSYTVRVGFWSSDPVKAHEVARSLLAAYLEDQVARKRRSAEMLFRWLEQRVDLLREKQEASAKAVNDFVTSSGLIDRGAQISLEAQLSTLSQEAAIARARAIEVTTRASTLATLQKSGGLDGAPEVLASATIQALKQSLTTALGRTVVMSPEHRTIADGIASESDRIVRSVDAEARNWIRREAALQEQIKSIRASLILRQQATMTLERLQQEAANDRAVLADALTRMKGQTANDGALRADVEVVSEPELPDRAAFPSLPLYALGSLFAAGLAGALMNGRVILARLRRLLHQP
ncbi:GumC family protein [Methylobacterium oryzihabitans]|uniref:Polysaccharide biosynthesis protein n=1 Tax=Methylobacterium oryzihabitans TaxID=2499852 RepID=A0A437P0X6_9HYPH|nr:polysaccharide biosynthesis protein [Methylobacterium oryzihabitans]RVU15949.1 polysaccharide biosynthesis protein [Methylobacterium oryzihabitans]